MQGRPSCSAGKDRGGAQGGGRGAAAQRWPREEGGPRLGCGVKAREGADTACDRAGRRKAHRICLPPSGRLWGATRPRGGGAGVAVRRTGRNGPSHPVAAIGAAMFSAATPWEEERGRRPHDTPGRRRGRCRDLWAAPSGRRREGAASPDPGRRRGSGKRMVQSDEPQAASRARCGIIARLMPRSSRSRVVSALSSRTVWR